MIPTEAKAITIATIIHGFTAIETIQKVYSR